MNKAILILLALAAVQANATEVNICSDSFWSTGAVDNTSTTVVGCAKTPCTVTKGSTITYSLKFTPSWPISDLAAHVKASRFGIYKTFLDGPSVCDKIFKASDNSPASCPLSPGVEYIYKDTIPVPKFVPTDRGTVTLALKSDSETVKCVEVLAKVG